MNDGGKKKSSFTMTVFFLADLRNAVILGVLVKKMKNEIQHKADCNTAKRFDTENGEDTNGCDLFGDHDREHFVRGGDENGNQRANGNHAAGIQVGSAGGKSALRNNAEQASRKRTETTCLCGNGGGLLRSLVFDPFQKKIGQKQKRNQL